MYNVDTLVLSMSTVQLYKKRNLCGEIVEMENYKHTRDVNKRIKSKLWLDEESRRIRDYRKHYDYTEFDCNKLERYSKQNIKWHGSYNGYVLNFNEDWNSLTVMLKHYQVEME